MKIRRRNNLTLSSGRGAATFLTIFFVAIFAIDMLMAVNQQITSNLAASARIQSISRNTSNESFLRAWLTSRASELTVNQQIRVPLGGETAFLGRILNKEEDSLTASGNVVAATGTGTGVGTRILQKELTIRCEP